MKRTSSIILFLFLLIQIFNFKTYGDMHDDMPMGDMPTVDQETYTKQISIPSTPKKVKDATLSKEEVLQILKNSSDKKPAYLWRKNLNNLDFSNVDFKGANFSPREFYHQLLEPQLSINDSRDICIMRTEAKGLKNNLDTTVVVESIERYDKDTGFKAMEKWTGWHASILAIEAAKASLPKGCISIENAMTGEDFLKEAKKRNFKINIKIN